MTVTAGQIRLFDWMLPERGVEAHAFTAGDRVPFRSVCEVGRWSVKAAKAEPGTQLCVVCTSIVLGAVHRALIELNAIEEGTTLPLRLAGIEQYQAEGR